MTLFRDESLSATKVDLAGGFQCRSALRSRSRGMATSTSRAAALSLMRRMLRVSRGWRGEGGADEARYIVQETSRVFRERKNLRDAEIIAGALDEGEGRLQTALHYGIAYPRMTHTPLAGGGDVKNVLPPAEAGGSSWASHVGEKGVSDAARNIAAHAAPVNPRANAAREAARAKRLAMMKATATATAEARTADDEDATG